jgi:hypothetical protein
MPDNKANKIKLNESTMRKGGINNRPNIPRPAQPPKPQNPKPTPPKK